MTLSQEREGRLTASTFGAAIGVNPYMSRQKLWRTIKGVEPGFEGNEMTEWGNDHESDAIDAYESHQGVIVDKSNDLQLFVKHPEMDWLGATPDGFNGNIVVEVKCPFNKMYEEIPPYYIAQIMGQMFITGLKECHFVAWRPEETKVWSVPFNDDYWAVELELLKEFWGYVGDDVEPKRKKKTVMPEVHYELLF